MENHKPRILIIDDEKGLRLGSQRLLESEGYSVDTAENGSEGCEKGLKGEFDIAVIDLKMPDIDGLEVLKELKKAKPNMVCFIATAYASYDTAIEATRLGAYSYIPKPFTPEELLHHIEKGYNHRVLVLESEKLKQEREARLLELASEKSRLNTIIKSITGGILVINKTGELVYYNDPAIKLLELDELTIGEYILNKLPDKIVALANKHLDSKEFKQKSYSAELEFKPNNELYLEIISSPVPHHDGTFAGVVLVIRNITEIKRLELLKSQFVSMVAHELKTPVAAVQGFLNIILDDSIQISAEQQKDYIYRSVVRLKGLLDLVNDLLDISRMELKTKQREIEELSVDEIMDSTLEMLEIEIKKRGLKLEKAYSENLPKIRADRNEIARVFTNILSNAIKYNSDKGKIKIDINSKANFLVIRISDTGIGLKPEEKSKLFQEFFRAKNEKTRGISGTGLGLTIVKRIVDSYHGIIEVESEYEIGTTFIIKLPKLKN